jgi:choline dehydrogenase-like flavoprotein
MAALSLDEQWTLLRIAEAATPPGRHVPRPDGSTLEAVERMLGQLGARAASGYRTMLSALDLAAVPLTGRRLASLPLEEREATLVRLNESEASFWLVRAVTAPLKVVQAQTEPLTEALRIKPTLAVARERHRFEERIVDARTLHRDEELEVDVVVVGTGAGGAPVAKQLAARGHAVAMIEEGSYFTRADFQGRALDRQRRLYIDHGFTVTVGNAVIPVPLGRTVGGTTTVNSGTCYRTPESVLRRWQVEQGLHELGPGSLDRYFERVEAMLEVQPASPETLGGVARVIARGCDALGWEHAPLRRNAPGCDAQALCCFGCPTDAKRSTNVSYVPAALAHGAMVYCNARVSKVLIEGGRAVGVVARATEGNGSAKTVTVRARAVVLACGSIGTPALLLRQGLANSSDQVGRNLTIHPAGYSYASFAESIRGFEAIPQGYAVEEFADQGLRFEGGFLPLEMAAGTFTHVGAKWTSLVERFDELAVFGFMIAETSRGRVVLDPGGTTRMLYRVNDEDVRRMVRAQGLLARIFFAAGAERVYPGMQRFGELEGLADVERLEREGPDSVRAHHIDLSAYHPLGTCRMGVDPKRSVIGPSHETHDVPGLFVVDGSAVPGPLGVNPQVTIMALAERASEHVARRVEEGVRARKVERADGTQVAFEETMSGLCVFEPSDGGGTREVAFTVKAKGPPLSALRGGVMQLEGTISLEGLVDGARCEGTLEMRPLARRGTLIYDLAFTDAQGAACTLHGEKHTGWTSPLRGMTTLHTELRREGALLARGVLTFDLADLQPWLQSFRLASGAR